MASGNDSLQNVMNVAISFSVGKEKGGVDVIEELSAWVPICSLTKLVDGAVVSHSTIVHQIAFLKQGQSCCKSGVHLLSFSQKGWTFLLCNSYNPRAQYLS